MKLVTDGGRHRFPDAPHDGVTYHLAEPTTFGRARWRNLVARHGVTFRQATALRHLLLQAIAAMLPGEENTAERDRLSAAVVDLAHAEARLARALAAPGIRPADTAAEVAAAAREAEAADPTPPDELTEAEGEQRAARDEVVRLMAEVAAIEAVARAHVPDYAKALADNELWFEVAGIEALRVCLVAAEGAAAPAIRRDASGVRDDDLESVLARAVPGLVQAALDLVTGARGAAKN
ncbi:MAG: hypothetical protein AB7H93_23620 [Vicinamibacterales bacterium]